MLTAAPELVPIPDTARRRAGVVGELDIDRVVGPRVLVGLAANPQVIRLSRDRLEGELEIGRRRRQRCRPLRGAEVGISQRRPSRRGRIAHHVPRADSDRGVAGVQDDVGRCGASDTAIAAINKRVARDQRTIGGRPPTGYENGAAGKAGCEWLTQQYGEERRRRSS